MTAQAEIEKENFTKFSHGIVGTGTSIAQDVLAKFIPCSNIVTEVQYHPLWYRLEKKQKAKVNGAPTEGYGNFDVTLIYTILRNVCINFGDPSKPDLPTPTRGWGKTPHPSFTTPSDDIERIRELKNTYYSHLAKASLPEAEFKIKWQELKDVCERMKTYLGKDYPRELRKLEDFPDEKITTLREELLKYNHSATQSIQVSPLEKFGKKLPIDQLYAPVVIREDLEQKHVEPSPDGGSEPKQERKLVNTPGDIFKKDGERVRFVFMQGEAAHGKTTYCLQLLRQWCNAKQRSKDKHSVWEKGLDFYDFVFPVTLRLVDKSRSSLLDMICYDTLNYSADCSETIRHVLCSDKYQCLILVDGLDEWKPSPEAKTNLTLEGIPNIKELPNCTVFATSRPWKFEVVSNLIKQNDRVIEIEGLHKDGVKTVIRNILVNYFNLKKESVELDRCYEEIVQKVERETLRHVMHVPLLLIVSVILLYRKHKVGESKTTFYMALITMLIDQTFENKPLDPSISQKFSKLKFSDFTIPALVQNEGTLNDFFVVLFKLGELAYEDLMSDETHLVFGKRQLAKKIGEAELEFSLNVGLLSQCQAPSSYTKQVSVNFLHKSVQEFHAAIYISSKKEVSDIFCKHLNSVKVIMELSNVIMFVSGLSPSLGIVLSQQIIQVANADTDICRWRDTFDFDTRNKVRLLYTLQVSCYREMKQGLSMLHITDTLTYHVSDVYLDNVTGTFDRDTVRTSVDLICNNPTHIVSLYLYCIPDDGERGITDRELTQILDNTTSLQYLCINGEVLAYRYISTVSDRFTSLKSLHLMSVTVTRDALCRLQRCIQHNTVLQSLTLWGITCLDNGKRKSASLHDILLCLPKSPCLSTLHIGHLYYTKDVQTLVEILPQLKCLRSIRYISDSNYHDADAAVAHTVCCMKQLQHIELMFISLGDRSLELSSEMSQIEKVKLQYVNMSAGGWNKFVQSLINIPHHFVVTLDGTDIDDKSRKMIGPPYFTVTKDEGKSSVKGFYKRLDFSRVTPSTPHTEIIYQKTHGTPTQ